MIRIAIVTILLLTTLLTACAIEPVEPVDAFAHLRLEATATAEAAHDHPMTSLTGMPAMVQTANARTQEAYRFAAANPDAARAVPCYCGCVGLGHASSYDCYVAGETADGSLEYDLHAANCTVCVDITHDQMAMMDDGASLADIRAAIDQEYARYGPPTTGEDTKY